MLQVFDMMPALLAILLLVAAGAAMSWRLDSWRVFVVLAIPFGYVLAFLKTIHVGTLQEGGNSPLWMLAFDGARLFLPLAMPALGSLLALQYEKRLDARKSDEAELTVDSLLMEKVPRSRPELTCDSLDID